MAITGFGKSLIASAAATQAAASSPPTRRAPAMRRALIALAVLCGAALPASAQTGAPTSADRGLASIDSDGDGSITRAEAQAARAGLFARLDADSDGFLNEQERTTGQGARLSTDSDSDGDERLSRAEFMGQPYRVFERLDADSNGVLSAAEIAAARAQR